MAIEPHHFPCAFSRQSETSNGVTHTYSYDLAGNRLQTVYGNNGKTIVSTYDAFNRLSTMSESGRVSGYDAINRLSVEAVSGSNAVTTAYVYDAANNRLSKVVTGGSNAGTTGYTYNALNQLTQYSDSQQSVALSYDANGNRATRTVTGGTASGGDTYGYDYENRLVTLAKGAGAVSGTYEYVYDYRTRRVVRDETVAGGVNTNVVFSGGLSVQEYAAGSTYASVEYIRGSDYGGGVGGILYTLRGGDASFTHENRRGDVIAKTNASGVLTYQACYEAYGTRTQENGSTQDRQEANTKDEDPTGLLNEGFRYRDLETGVFITADPAGFVDGPNLYAYVKQNPWTSFDPEGLMAQAAAVPALVSMGPVGWTILAGATGVTIWQGYKAFQHYHPSTIAQPQKPELPGIEAKPQKPATLPGTTAQPQPAPSLPGPSVDKPANQQIPGFTPAPAQQPFLPGITPMPNADSPSGVTAFQRRNKLEPDTTANGPHSTFRVDPRTGEITHYQTWQPQTNPQDPKPWESVKRYDGTGTAHGNVPTPHIHENSAPNGVRRANPDEIPSKPQSPPPQPPPPPQPSSGNP